MSTFRIDSVNDFHFLKGTWFKVLQLLILMSLHTHIPLTPTHSDHLWSKDFFKKLYNVVKSAPGHLVGDNVTVAGPIPV